MPEQVAGSGEWRRGEAVLVGPHLAQAWTGHSERATLPSLLAAAGVSRESRELVGRWRAEGSDEYVRTYKAMVKRMHLVFRACLQKDVYQGFDEEDALQDVKKNLSDRSLWTDEARVELERLVVFAKYFAMKLVKDNVDDELAGLLVRAAASGVEADEEPNEEHNGGTAGAVVQSTPQVVRFVVSESARGRVFRLHLHDGCWRARQRAFSKYAEFLENTVPPSEYNLICANCFGTSGFEENEVEDSGSSASSSCD